MSDDTHWFLRACQIDPMRLGLSPDGQLVIELPTQAGWAIVADPDERTARIAKERYDDCLAYAIEREKEGRLIEGMKEFLTIIRRRSKETIEEQP